MATPNCWCLIYIPICLQSGGEYFEEAFKNHRIRSSRILQIRKTDVTNYKVGQSYLKTKLPSPQKDKMMGKVVFCKKESEKGEKEKGRERKVAKKQKNAKSESTTPPIVPGDVFPVARG